MFNNSPRKLTSLKNERVQFKLALARVVNTHACHSTEEILMVKMAHNQTISCTVRTLCNI